MSNHYGRRAVVLAPFDPAHDDTAAFQVAVDLAEGGFQVEVCRV